MRDVAALLGDDADFLLGHTAKAIPAEDLHLPGPDFVDRVACATDRSPQVLRNLQALFDHGRLAGTGYVSILPVDQGVEHSGAASFAPNPAYFDPEGIVRSGRRGRLQRGGLHLRRARFGIPSLGAPHPVHREAQPQRAAEPPQQLRPGGCSARCSGPSSSARRAWEPPSTSARRESRRPDRRESARRSTRPTASACSACCGATCAVTGFKVDGVDYHGAADLTGQANHLGVTIEADIIKQKLPENNGGYAAVGFGQTQPAGVRAS